MANHLVGELTGIVDKRKAVAATTTASSLATAANYSSIGTLRTRLAAINAGYYTTAMLDSMTYNDMVYAVRVNDDVAGI